MPGYVHVLFRLRLHIIIAAFLIFHKVELPRFTLL